MNPTSEAFLSTDLPLAEAFRGGMRHLASGVCVVAARSTHGIPLGVTCLSRRGISSSPRRTS
ncbi:PNPOx family protein [Paraburkholderia sediminicola]|uniref:hypothetical protein n=1 Tax=Paraburkholderia sediminicola TaxID=458836 RepID=UPI0038B8D1CC